MGDVWLLVPDDVKGVEAFDADAIQGMVEREQEMPMPLKRGLNGLAEILRTGEFGAERLGRMLAAKEFDETIVKKAIESPK